MTYESLKLLASNHRDLLKQILRYGAVGVINTTLTFLIFNLLIVLTGISSGIYITLFSLMTFSVVVTIAFYLNAHWVFKRSDHATISVYKKFLLVSGSVALFNVFVIHFIVNVIGAPQGISSHLWANIALLATIVTSVLGNFTGSKFFVFK